MTISIFRNFDFASFFNFDLTSSVMGLDICSDFNVKSKFLLHFASFWFILPQVRQKVRQNDAKWCKNVGTLGRWDVGTLGIWSKMMQKFPGRWDVGVKFPGRWGKTSRDVGTLGPNSRDVEAKRPGTLGRWDVGISTWNQISKVFFSIILNKKMIFLNIFIFFARKPETQPTKVKRKSDQTWSWPKYCRCLARVTGERQIFWKSTRVYVKIMKKKSIATNTNDCNPVSTKNRSVEGAN